MHYSFVVDRHGPFACQGYVLARSLLEFGGASPHQITVHVVEGTDPAMVAPFRELRTNVAHVSPFPGHPYCNKINQIPALLDVDADLLLLLDADLFVLRPFEFGAPLAIRGKIVDLPNAPIRVLERVFRAAGLDLRVVDVDLCRGKTAAANFNGGLYAIPRCWAGALHAAWLRWAQWCLANVRLFRDHSLHVDQVSFALAVTDLELATEFLDRRYNCPTHLGPVAATDGPPIALHYHRHVDGPFRLRPTGAPVLDEEIARANAALARWQSDGIMDALLSSDPVVTGDC